MAVARLLQHLECHIDSDDTAAGAYLTGGDECVEARAGANVNNTLALLHAAQLKGAAHSRERLHRAIRQSLDRGWVVAQPGRKPPPGVEVVRRVGRERDVSILLLYLLPELRWVHWQALRHGQPPPGAIRLVPFDSLTPRCPRR